jgi:hypothetical protein
VGVRAPVLEIPRGEPASCVPAPYAVAFATESTWWVGALHAGRHWRPSLLGVPRPRFFCERPVVHAAGLGRRGSSSSALCSRRATGGAGWTTLRP